MDNKTILAAVDHTLLQQTATWQEIKQICDDGVIYGCASVCIPAAHVKQAADYVTADIDDDGIAKALKHFELI